MPIFPTCTEYQLVVVYLHTVFESHLLVGRIYLLYCHAATKLNIVLAVPVGRLDVPVIETLLTTQISFGQWRTPERDT